MPMVNGKKYPYTAAGKAAAKKAAASAKPKVTPKPKPKPTPTKKSTPTPKPNKNWRTAPPDYDVIIPGFNDPATIKKYTQKKKGK